MSNTRESQVSEFYGLSESDITEQLESGTTLAQISASCGKNRSMLTRWIQADEQRSALCARARQLGAAAHEEKAEDEIRRAGDPFELSKAKELAHHFRWRASKLAPREYGDKLDVAHSGGVTLVTTAIDERL